MRVAIVGFGLIGGSIARALGVAPDRDAWSLAAWSPSGEGPRRAAAEGVIASAAADLPAVLDGAALVVLAAPPTRTLDLLDRLGGPLRAALDPGTVLTDVASTKAAVMATAARHGLRFVGGHPMAGLEASGYDAATPDLFEGRPWVVTPGDGEAAPDPAAVLAVETLAVACRAIPIRLGADEHDAAVAAISHLPLVLAAALVESVAGGSDASPPDWPLAQRLAAGGWRDMTRLARGDATMGAGIAVTNAPAVAGRIRSLQAVLDGWLADLERPGGPDEDRLARRLRAARDRLDRAP